MTAPTHVSRAEAVAILRIALAVELREVPSCPNRRRRIRRAIRKYEGGSDER